MPAPSENVRPGNAWFDFAYLSNELTTPRILACPSDKDTKLATEFSTRTNGGLMDPGFRFRSVSYGIGLESVADLPRAWLSGDRNLGATRGGSGCSSRVNNITFYSTMSTPLAWTNGVAHGEFGHILLSDGSVEFTSTSRLRELLLFPPADDNGFVHFIRAR